MNMTNKFNRQTENESAILKRILRELTKNTVANSAIQMTPNSFVLSWPGGAEFVVVVEQTEGDPREDSEVSD